MMKEKFHFVAVSGSLRKASWNTMVLKAAQQLVPENVHIEHLSIDWVPLYNFDLHNKRYPDVVEKLDNVIKAADAVIFVTPEYNYSVPGVLKNFIDFASKSPLRPFDMKPVGIISASTGLLGAARAQYHLRQIMVALNAYVMNQPEIMIAEVDNKFDAAGNITDEKTKQFIYSFITALASFTDMIQQAQLKEATLQKGSYMADLFN